MIKDNAYVLAMIEEQGNNIMSRIAVMSTVFKVIGRDRGLD